MGEMPVTAAAAVPREASPHVFVAYRSYGTMVQSTDPSPYPHDWWSHLPNPLRQFGERVAQFFSPSAEAAATTESYEIALELPRVAEDGIHLEVRGDRLPRDRRETRPTRGKRQELLFLGTGLRPVPPDLPIARGTRIPTRRSPPTRTGS